MAGSFIAGTAVVWSTSLLSLLVSWRGLVLVPAGATLFFAIRYFEHAGLAASLFEGAEGRTLAAMGAWRLVLALIALVVLGAVASLLGSVLARPLLAPFRTSDAPLLLPPPSHAKRPRPGGHRVQAFSMPSFSRRSTGRKPECTKFRQPGQARWTAPPRACCGPPALPSPAAGSISRSTSTTARRASRSMTFATALARRQIDFRFVARAHRAGQRVLAWTVTGEADTRRMLDLGVDGLITDDVATAIRVRDAWAALDPRTQSLKRMERLLSGQR